MTNTTETEIATHLAYLELLLTRFYSGYCLDETTEKIARSSIYLLASQGGSRATFHGLKMLIDGLMPPTE